MPIKKTKYSRSIDDIELPLSSHLELVGCLENGIYKGEMTDINGHAVLTTVIVKTLKDKHNKDQENRLRHELDIMRKISLHNNIIQLIGCIFKSPSRSPNPSIIMEFAANGTIKDFLQNHPGMAITETVHGQISSICNPIYEDANAPTPEKLVDFIGQIANGMKHLSDMNIIHRKLGARNVFLDNKMVCKIGSFSKAIWTKDFEIRDNKETYLPSRWMALESLNNGTYSTKTDVWAFGVLMWEF
ncbi:tyrosine kinase receptor Cad96Ca-like [Ptychodera flava]|uniref:tyrosine kinase receptor Cad96Ca-like n=1 Tax=Ptychodera flava TaxID=63121 RepID=UPI00396A749A